ncbi:hypothetical protein [Mycobacteroides chelonae]|uniref:hypothetical protein n=1 Tax=Mycobacteroides chelonae TaxID=1774 RepID=UPI0012FFBE59|nr:hypothetical protein [Mycobacteroides chelonae]
MPSRVKVVPVRGWDGHIQGWAVNYEGYEYYFEPDRDGALMLGNSLAMRLYAHR